MKLTKIAIALVAVLAMSAVVASAASANQLTSNSTKVNLHGVDTVNHKFTVDGQNVTCNESKFNTGEVSIPANEITANAVYTGCTAFGFAGATVNMGNCHYKITTPTKIVTDEYTSAVDVVCKDTTGQNGGANVINVSSSVFGSECAVSIGEKTGTNHIIIKNTTNNVPKDLTLEITVSEITATKNKDNGLCPLSGTGTVNNAAYNGSLTITDNGGADIWLS